MHPVVNHQKKKRNAKVTTNNTGNNGTMITSRPVNNAYDLLIPSTDYNRNNRNLADHILFSSETSGSVERKISALRINGKREKNSL